MHRFIPLLLSLSLTPLLLAVAVLLELWKMDAHLLVLIDVSSSSRNSTLVMISSRILDNSKSSTLNP